MDLRECAERFLASNWEEIEIPCNNPESSRVILWRYLKIRRERIGDYSNRISISKTRNSIILRKTKDLPDEAIVTLKGGTKVPLRDLLGPSQEIKRLCEKIKAKIEGTLPSYEDVKIPTIEEIETWDLSKPDRELLLKTIKDIIKVNS